MAELIQPDSAENLAMGYAVDLHLAVPGGDSPVDNDALIATYHAIHRALTQPVPDPAMTAVEARLTLLEERMATLNEQMARINDETNEIGTVVDGAVTAIQDLRTRLADLDTTAAAQLGEIADRLSGTSDRLSAVAADPTNPVPEPGPGEPV